MAHVLLILKIVGLVLSVLTFIFIIVSMAVPDWSKCERLEYTSGLWAYKDVSVDTGSLYEDLLTRVINRKLVFRCNCISIT